MSGLIIKKPRRIIDRKALKAKLDILANGYGHALETQGAVLRIYKEGFIAGWDEVRRRFEHGEASGSETTYAHAYLMDQLVRLIHEFATNNAYPTTNPTIGEQMAVVATGGYGRSQLAPFSDIDLMFLLPYKLTPHSEQVIEYTLYSLWDLGLKVGHATRSVDETLRLAVQDLTIRTSLLDARWLWGNQVLFKDFEARFHRELVIGSGTKFVEGKLAERDLRHRRMGDSRYVLEPNLKDGKGGLRDLQTLFWIGKYLYQASSLQNLKEAGVLTAAEVKSFSKAESFLWTVRCHLHYLARRPEERLTFHIQEELGQRMGYKARAGTSGVERFMKHYFLTAKDVGDLTRSVCAVLEEQQQKRLTQRWFSGFRFNKKEIEGFWIERGRITISSAKTLKENPVLILKLFREAQYHKLDIHPRAMRIVSQNLNLIGPELRSTPEANRLFLEILTGPNPRTALMWLNETGVFGRFIPDFGRVVGQMQYDMYHVYTVDEHTIRAIDILDGICTGRLKDDHPVSSEVVSEIQSQRALFVAVLLHDIAKGRDGDHSVLGATVAENLCPRLGLSDWETETVVWLVRWHLLMSRLAFKRDLEDPKTIADFVEQVQSPERLRMLLVLTVSDIRAVGPKVWNSWKAGLLRELYWRAQEVLSGAGPTERRTERVKQTKQQLRQRLADWSSAKIEAHFDRGQSSYWLSLDIETLVRHAFLIDTAKKKEENFRIETSEDKDRGICEVTVYAPDHPGLFAKIAAALALSRVSICDAKINTLNNGMALDNFTILLNQGDGSARSFDQMRLRTRIANAIQGKLRVATEFASENAEAMRRRNTAFSVSPRVLIDNRASDTYTVIELNGHDRPGLLHDVTQALTDEGLQIASAHISTYGERVVDVFYVKNVFGLKIDSKTKEKAVRARLLDTILDGTEMTSPFAAE